MGKRRTTAGKKLVGLEISIKVNAELTKFAKARGEGKGEVVDQALRRHMDNPPPLPKKDLPPLPDVK